MTPRTKRLLKYTPPAFGGIVLVAIILGLRKALEKIGPRDVLDALAATSPVQVFHALGLLAVSVLIMTIYDVPGVRFVKARLHLPKIGVRHVAFASLSAYALSHVLGAPALTGAAIRVRLYAQWRLPPASIAGIIAISGTIFFLGAITLAGLVLLLRPLSVPLFGHDVSTVALRVAGAALVAAVGAYVFVAGRSQNLVLFRRAIPLPGRGVAVSQIAVGCADMAVACGILFAVLPAVPGLDFAHVLAIYLAAVVGGSLSGLPAGLGVLDTLLLLGLSPFLDPAVSIGAILLFRVFYALIPASAAALCFAGHEIFLTAKGQSS